MTTGAETARENDVGAGVDSYAVVLVVDSCAGCLLSVWVQAKYGVNALIVTPSESPISKASVFLARASPALASIVMYANSVLVTWLMLKTWTGGLTMVSCSIRPLVILWAWKNLGLL